MFFDMSKNICSESLLTTLYKNKIIKKDTQAFAPRLLIFKVQQKVLQFNDICVSWSLPKGDQLEKTFLEPQNLSFENLSFAQ